VLGSSKAVNAASLAVFDPSTNIALSRQPESAAFFLYIYAGIWASTLDLGKAASTELYVFSSSFFKRVSVPLAGGTLGSVILHKFFLKNGSI
jgi:hypothetical protein